VLMAHWFSSEIDDLATVRQLRAKPRHELGALGIGRRCLISGLCGGRRRWFAFRYRKVDRARSALLRHGRAACGDEAEEESADNTRPAMEKGLRLPPDRNYWHAP
jgi:hypothetical protein